MIALALSALLSGQANLPENQVFTLYRNSALDPSMRVHVATFDTDNGAAYNNENCGIAASLFASQDGVSVQYWCEQGRFR